jgi:putative zinc finger protein
MTGRIETRGTAPFADHPDAIATAAYLDGTLPDVTRDDFEAHLAACDECRAGVAILRLGSEDDAEAVPPEILRRARSLSNASVPSRPRRRAALPAGIAAGLLAATGLALWMAGWVGHRVPPTGRSGADAPETGSPVEREGGGPVLQGLGPAGGEMVDASRLAFRWSPIDGADRYVVTVLDAGGNEVAALEIGPPGGQVPWPADRPLLPAGTYLWAVRALVLDRVLAETRPIPFEVR